MAVLIPLQIFAVDVLPLKYPSTIWRFFLFIYIHLNVLRVLKSIHNSSGQNKKFLSINTMYFFKYKIHEGHLDINLCISETFNEQLWKKSKIKDNAPLLLRKNCTSSSRSPTTICCTEGMPLCTFFSLA